MDRTPVSSTNIKAVGYDAASKTLAIEFHSGKVYHYSDVEPEKHQALLAAPSIGKHFGAHIKPHHACTAQKD